MTVKIDSGRRRRFEWQEGDLIPFTGKLIEIESKDYKAELPTELQAILLTEVLPTYMDEWWAAIEATSRTQIRTAIATMAREGYDTSYVVSQLEKIFSPARAQLVAVTEVTRLFAKGAQAAYRANGVKQVTWRSVRDPWVCATCSSYAGKDYDIGTVEPPAHPRCRCFLSPVIVKQKSWLSRVVEDLKQFIGLRI